VPTNTLSEIVNLVVVTTGRSIHGSGLVLFTVFKPLISPSARGPTSEHHFRHRRHKDTLHLTMYTFGAMNIFFAHSSMNQASVAQLISGDVNA